MRVRFICGVVLCAMLLSTGQAGAAAKAEGEHRITVDLRSASIENALQIVFRGTTYSYLLMPGVTASPRPVTVSLKDVGFTRAVELVCEAAGLTYVRKGDAFIITAREAVVTVGGGQVPIVAAMRAGDLEAYLRTVPGGSVVSVAPGGRLHRVPGEEGGPPVIGPHRVLPGLQDEMITFEADSLPLREAMARLAKETGHDVYLPAAAPDAVRITARVYLVPIQDFLQNVARQAGLSLRYTLVDAAGKQVHWVTIEPGGATRIDLQPTAANGLRYRFCLVPETLVGIVDGTQILRQYSGYEHSSRESIADLFGPEAVDLEVREAPLRTAMAKLSASSGHDIVVSEAVPATLKVSIRAYCQPVRGLLGRIAEGAELEIREQWVFNQTGTVIPREADPMTLEQDEAKGRVHRRYTFVPKSEIKVTGGVPDARQPDLPVRLPPGTRIPRKTGIIPLGEPPAPPYEVEAEEVIVK